MSRSRRLGAVDFGEGGGHDDVGEVGGAGTPTATKRPGWRGLRWYAPLASQVVPVGWLRQGRVGWLKRSSSRRRNWSACLGPGARMLGLAG